MLDLRRDYIDPAVNTTVHSLVHASGGTVSERIAETLVRAALTSTGLNILYLILTETQFQILAFLYRRGVLKRVQDALPDDRDIPQVLLAATSVTFPVGLYQAWNHHHLAAKTLVRFNVVEILVLQIALFLAVDTWYFWGHRFMHKNKFFWNNVHKHHHEKKNINVYSTAYAAFVENLILISPVIIITFALYDALSPVFNPLAWRMAMINQSIVFNLGHCGFRFHPVMHLFVSPSGWTHTLLKPFDLSQVPEDHEMHHLYPLSNFSLNFRIWDTIMGSYKPIEHIVAMKGKRNETKKE
ncbi:C-4 sterol methyl oxidase [Phlyctochytrium bullatum]|nr:C-4 sterol methyl oxidase [Phlyctochytrium bullatum]